MTKMYVCKVYSKLLETSEIMVVSERNGKKYFGPLFNSKDPDERITRYLREVTVECEDSTSEDFKVYETYLDLCKEYGIKFYDSTLGTMKHWSYVNGFTDEIHI